MAGDGMEIIIGAKNDISFGPCVLLGLGGTAAEALDDVAVRLAPLDIDEARDMISELKASSLFNGWRGSPRLDTDQVADALVRIGSLMVKYPDIKEIDINPVRVYPKGIIALDALFITNPA